MEALRSDFLDRDQDNYVRIRRSGRLGWESLIPAGGNYSDMLRDCRVEGDIIKEAYGMARDYIVAMDTPYKVTLRLSPQALFLPEEPHIRAYFPNIHPKK